MKNNSRPIVVVVLVLGILCKSAVAYLPRYVCSRRRGDIYRLPPSPSNHHPKVEYWFKFLNDDNPKLGTIQTDAKLPGGHIRILSKDLPSGTTNLVHLFAAKKSDTSSESYATALWVHVVGATLNLSSPTNKEFLFTYERLEGGTFFIQHGDGRTLLPFGRLLAVVKLIPEEKFKRELQIQGSQSQIDELFRNLSITQSGPNSIQILRLINAFNYKENTFPLPARYACGPFELKHSTTGRGDAPLTVIASWINGGENAEPLYLHSLRIQGDEKNVLGGYLVLKDSPKGNVFEVRVRRGTYEQVVNDLKLATKDGRLLMISAPMPNTKPNDDFLNAPMKYTLLGIHGIHIVPDVRRDNGKICVHVTFESLKSFQKPEKSEAVSEA